MEEHAKIIVEELARGEILLYLRKVYPEGATPLTLRHYLQERVYVVDEGKFAFHVRYLAEAGFVTYELFRQKLGEPEEIRLVKITRVGIDEVDGRPKSSSGVRF
jgi:hypothetical protein